jgi:hypothetical protein
LPRTRNIGGGDVEQGPDELSDRGEERGRDLERSTNTPLDEQGDSSSDRDDDEDEGERTPAGLETIDPGL